MAWPRSMAKNEWPVKKIILVIKKGRNLTLLQWSFDPDQRGFCPECNLAPYDHDC